MSCIKNISKHDLPIDAIRHNSLKKLNHTKLTKYL